MNRIFVAGDFHGHYDIKKINSKKFPEGLELDKNDYLIQLGDFGLFFNNNQTNQEKYWLNWLNNKPWTTLFLRGNHDNYDLIHRLGKLEEKFNSNVLKMHDSIYFLQDGMIYTIANKKFLIVGGAFSIDKEQRVSGVDWWPNEEMGFLESKSVYESLDENNWEVDYILTHDAPSFVRDDLHSHHLEDSYTVRLLDDVFSNEKLKFNHHYFGHHHMDKTVFKKHTCCFYKIREIT